MALRTWTSSQIKQLWLAGLAVEALLFVGPWYCARVPTMPTPDPVFQAAPLSDSARHLLERQLDSAGIKITHRPDSSIEFRRNDTVYAVMHPPRGQDSVGHLEMSPAMKAKVDTFAGAVIGGIGRSISEGVQEAMPRLVLILALIYLPIPMGLIITTILWIQRSRDPAPNQRL